MTYVVCAMYKFVTLEDYESMREPLLALMQENEIKGSLLLALEGINGTVSSSREGIDALLAWLASDERFEGISVKESFHDEPPFHRTKVKLKREIVTMGIPDVDPRKRVGTYVKPKDWNALISDPDVLLIDTRNDYEVAIGTFEGAVDPDIETFREFPEYMDETLDPTRHKKVAMFCTGGIRCEKSTSYLVDRGFEHVYHLEGGILKYLEEVAPEESMWEGECFVFDERVSVNHELERGSYGMCHACRWPLSAEDLQSEYYVPGVSCPHCHEDSTQHQKQRYAERALQIELARRRDEPHMGDEMQDVVQRRREEKLALKNEQKQRN